MKAAISLFIPPCLMWKIFLPVVPRGWSVFLPEEYDPGCSPQGQCLRKRPSPAPISDLLSQGIQGSEAVPYDRYQCHQRQQYCRQCGTGIFLYRYHIPWDLWEVYPSRTTKRDPVRLYPQYEHQEQYRAELEGDFGINAVRQSDRT